jgi:hypothetical protein
MATKPIAAPSVTAPAPVVVELTREQLLAKIAELQAKEAKNALPRSPFNVVIDTNVPCKDGKTCAFLTVTSNEEDYTKRTVVAKYILGDGRTRVLESGAKRTHFYAETARQSEPEQMF